MGCFSIIAIPSAGVSFFLSAWILMIFWGILAVKIDINTISYIDAMIATIALWMVIAPLITALAGFARRK